MWLKNGRHPAAQGKSSSQASARRMQVNDIGVEPADEPRQAYDLQRGRRPGRCPSLPAQVLRPRRSGLVRQKLVERCVHACRGGDRDAPPTANLVPREVRNAAADAAVDRLRDMQHRETRGMTRRS